VCYFGVCELRGRVGGVCLYGLFIRFVYMGGCVVKVFRGFRFGSGLYAGFGRLACVGGCTVAGVFERFMSCCVEGGVWFFLTGALGGLRLRLGCW
jgi:hypothetical protein